MSVTSVHLCSVIYFGSPSRNAVMTRLTSRGKSIWAGVSIPIERARGRREQVVPKDGKAAGELKKRTLTNLYNERPAWLANAHEKLDRAVFAAYGWEYPLEDQEILSRLLAENLRRAALP